MTDGTNSGGGSIDRQPDWLDEMSHSIEKFVEASAEEAKSIGEGIRRVFSNDRMEAALQALRHRLTNVTSAGRTSADPALEEARALREQVRDFDWNHTIEDWPRHSISPPSIRI